MNMPVCSPLRTLVLVMGAAFAAAATTAAPTAATAEPVHRVVVVGKRLPPPAVEPQGVQQVVVVGRRAQSTAKASEALATRFN